MTQQTSHWPVNYSRIEGHNQESSIFKHRLATLKTAHITAPSVIPEMNSRNAGY